jgi:hypothetical protein
MRRGLLDPLWKYIPSSTHADARAFRRRQQQRLREAQAQAAETQAKVAPLRKQAGKIDIDALVALECIGLAAIVFAAMAMGFI